LEPQKGDIIEHVFSGKGGELDTYDWDTGAEYELTSRPYRSALLGEDGLEDAYRPFEQVFAEFLKEDELCDTTRYWAVDVVNLSRQPEKD
jgi:hypothetical protein